MSAGPGHRDPRAAGPALSPPCPAGLLHEDLRLLLDTALPPKRKKVTLGVGDAKMGAAVLEELGVQCQTGGVVAELLRGEWGQGDRGHLGGALLWLGFSREGSGTGGSRCRCWEVWLGWQLGVPTW